MLFLHLKSFGIFVSIFISLKVFLVPFLFHFKKKNCFFKQFWNSSMCEFYKNSSMWILKKKKTQYSDTSAFTSLW